MGISYRDLEALKSAKGGYTRKTLEALGVPWPPPKGWKRRLLAAERSVDRCLGCGVWLLLDGSTRRYCEYCQND